MTKKEFFAKLEPVLSPSELIRVRAAYIFAKFGHRAQFRKELDSNGKPTRYFEHVRRVALILFDEIRIYDTDMICAALLHDALEDTEDIKPEILEQMFGIGVTRLVKCLTKTKQDTDVFYLDRLSVEKRALLVKVCDRLDNVRSLNVDGVDELFQRRQARETLDKYLPLFKKRFNSKSVVGYLDEMESVCLKILHK